MEFGPDVAEVLAEADRFVDTLDVLNDVRRDRANAKSGTPLIVVDTNVIACLWLPNERRADARALLQSHNRWFAPLLWRSEFRNILAGYLRRERLSIEEARVAYDGAAQMLRGSERMPTTKAVLDLVAASDLSAYDCEFVAVADTLAIPLFTADRKILRSFPRTARALGQPLR